MDEMTPELLEICCPECAPGAKEPHNEPDVPHIHFTSYGYLLFAPNHEFRDFIEEIRQVERRAGREDAAREILAHADRFAPAEGNVQQQRLRRHLLIGAQVAAPDPSSRQLAEAVARGDYIGCHLDDAGQPIDLGRFRRGVGDNTEEQQQGNTP
jgi:hypothetical protein